MSRRSVKQSPDSGSQIAVLLCLFTLSYATGLSFPIQRQLLNDAIVDSSYRATLMSLESIIDRGLCAWSASVIGSYLASGKLSQFLVLSGEVNLGFLIILAVCFRFVARPAR